MVNHVFKYDNCKFNEHCWYMHSDETSENTKNSNDTEDVSDESMKL